MLDDLQQHPQEVKSRELIESFPTHTPYVYPLVLIGGCITVFALRKSVLPRFTWNRRRFYPSRYEV